MSFAALGFLRTGLVGNRSSTQPLRAGQADLLYELSLFKSLFAVVCASGAASGLSGPAATSMTSTFPPRDANSDVSRAPASVSYLPGSSSHRLPRQAATAHRRGLALSALDANDGEPCAAQRTPPLGAASGTRLAPHPSHGPKLNLFTVWHFGHFIISIR